jgi:uncharacterized protein (DUF1697 family)
MAKLKELFDELGYGPAKTYINSGNVIFNSNETSLDALTKRIEASLDTTFDPGIRVLVKTRAELQAIVSSTPAEWVNDTTTKCDVMFLWPEVNAPEVLRNLPHNPEIEEVRYVPGAVTWCISRSVVTKSRMTRIIGTKLYAAMTVRNINTVRKLVALAAELT